MATSKRSPWESGLPATRPSSSSGKAELYATAEFPELMGISDRIAVLYDGKVVRELDTADTTEEQLLLYSTGGHHG